MLRLLEEPQKKKKEFSARFGDQLEAERHGIICTCVMGDSKLLEYNLYSSLKYWENMF